MTKFPLLRLGVPLIISSFGLLAGSANALTISFSGTSGGSPVAVSADVTTSAGLITVVLNTTTSDPTSVIQLVSGFNFTVSGLSGTNTAALNSNLQPGRTIAGDKSFTTANVQTQNLWNASNSGTAVSLTALGNPEVAGAFANPAGLIIGSGPYTLANGSIAGNAPHNPFLLTGATFLIGAPGVTANSVITGGTFLFGTEGTPPDNRVPDGGSTAVLLGMAAIGLGWFARRKS